MTDPPPSYNPAGSDLGRLTDKKSTSPHLPPVPCIADSSKSPPLLRPQDSHGSRSLRNSASIAGLFRKNRHAIEPVVGVETVRTAVIEDVRLIVQPNTGSVAERLALLKSCAELCGRHKLDMSALLQSTPSFYAHTALYWVIVNGLDSPPAPFELLAALLAHSQPLNAATIKDVRRACIAVRSQEMFQFLRMCPEFGALSEDNRFILGSVVPPEDIRVEIKDGPQQAFSVKFHIPMFEKRMMLGKIINLEFIARDRLWRLLFYIPGNQPKLIPKTSQEWFEEKRWRGHLRLCENSPGTHLEAGIVLLDARTTTEPVHAWNHLQSSLPFRNEDDSSSDSTAGGWAWWAFGTYKGTQV
ncbi:hypothetical protein DFH06DRAFT_1114310 [Mycena polygramma]|nr:hypothetical protein DFH06DRAFT_1114310 [Mycena polygramma]